MVIHVLLCRAKLQLKIEIYAPTYTIEAAAKSMLRTDFFALKQNCWQISEINDTTF